MFIDIHYLKQLKIIDKSLPCTFSTHNHFYYYIVLTLEFKTGIITPVRERPPNT